MRDLMLTTYTLKRYVTMATYKTEKGVTMVTKSENMSPKTIHIQKTCHHGNLQTEEICYHGNVVWDAPRRTDWRWQYGLLILFSCIGWSQNNTSMKSQAIMKKKRKRRIHSTAFAKPLVMYAKTTKPLTTSWFLALLRQPFWGEI